MMTRGIRPASLSSWHRPLTPLQRFVRIDWPLLLLAALIAAIGTATLYSVAGGAFAMWAERHVLRFLFGVALALAIGLVPLAVWQRLAYPAYAVALAPLALMPLIGTEAMGARRWIALGAGFSFQPSEIMKVALVAALARYFHDLPRERISDPRALLGPVVLVALPVVLTLRQPDLGTALLFAALGLGLMFLAGISTMYFAAGGISAVAAMPVVWAGLHDYQRKRIEVYLDPGIDPQGAGYHITQSKIALGSGGLEGKGFLMGTQSRLDFVPEKHTDFAFAMFGEEWGFVGAVVVISLYALLVALLLRRAASAKNAFGRLVTAGAALSVFAHAFVNIAMVSGLLPVVGVPLPLISYGGSAMLSLMAAMGLAMSAYLQRHEVNTT